MNGKRKCWKNVLKEYWTKDRIFVFVSCMLFMLVGILLMQVEVYQDSWYIEASADGTFGNDNRGYLTLGSNFLLLFFIRLLSMTGIRLFWFNIILLLADLISSILICEIICRNFKGRLKYGICLLILLLFTPMLYWYLQFTTSAAYISAVGCLYLFEALENNRPKKARVFAILWIFLGYLIRVDCIYFSLFFMGLVWLYKVISRRKKFSTRSGYMKEVWRWMYPFLVALILMGSFEIAQRALMIHHHDDFIEWNQVRSSVDDYAIPSYYEYKKEYQKIGISEEDYNLLRTWNYWDSDKYTLELLKDIQKLQTKVNAKEANAGSELKNAYRVIASNTSFWFLVLGVLLLYPILEKSMFFYSIFMLFTIEILSFYFSCKGRLIWRIYYSILMVAIIAILALMLSSKKLRHHQCKNKKILIAISMGMILLCFWGVSGSVFDGYYSRIFNDSTYCRNRFKSAKEEKVFMTMSQEGTQYMKEHKENLFFVLFDSSFLQQYPLAVKSNFCMEEVGAAENWGNLGQYMIKLSPIMHNMERYNITNPLRDIVNANVRVTVKDEELFSKTRAIFSCLRDDGYDDLSFSVEHIAGNCVFGRYMRDYSLDKVEKIDGGIKDISIKEHEKYRKMAVLNFSIEGIGEDILRERKVYIKVKYKSGKSKTFYAMPSQGQYHVISYNDEWKKGEKYQISVILEDGSGQKTVLKEGAMYKR